MYPTAALGDLNVVEYGDLVSAPYCARLLADAGADVVKVETPGGDSSRNVGPFAGKGSDPEASGLYLYLNANKRGITLDLEAGTDREIFRGLLRRADVLIVNLVPRELNRLELRRSHLADGNPRLIVTAVTPFGLSGPYCDYQGDDLIAVAGGGLAYATPGVPDMVNDPDQEPPLRADAYTSDFLAGIQAAAATVLAVLSRGATGRGCEVDVSQQEAVAMVLTWELAHASYLEPKGREPMIFGAAPNAYMPCKDGYIVMVGFLPSHWEAIVDLLGSPEWARSEVFADGAERARNWDALELLLLEWTMAHTGEEIAHMAQSRGIPCFPAYTVGQMVASDHVRERGYLLAQLGPGGKGFEMPGYPVRMGATPWRLRRPAPRHGEHTNEVLKEWLGSARARVGPG